VNTSSKTSAPPTAASGRTGSAQTVATTATATNGSANVSTAARAGPIRPSPMTNTTPESAPIVGTGTDQGVIEPRHRGKTAHRERQQHDSRERRVIRLRAIRADPRCQLAHHRRRLRLDIADGPGNHRSLTVMRSRTAPTT
jgi:hypothetical protein